MIDITEEELERFLSRLPRDLYEEDSILRGAGEATRSDDAPAPEG